MMKDSKIGMIPIDWVVKNLGSNTELIKDGTHASHQNVNNGIPLLSAKDIKNGRIQIPDDSRKISQEDFDTIHKNFKLKNSDILLTVVGTIGRVAILNDYSNNFTFQRSVSYIRLKDGQNPNFYVQYFQSNSFLRQLKLRANASAQAGVYLGELGKIPIPIPPKQEQQKIAEILSTVDAKIEVIDLQIKETEQLKKGMMQRLLTKGIGHTEFKDSKLGKIPKSWEVKMLSEFTDEVTDYVAAGSFAALRENVNVFSEPNYAIYVRLTDLRKGLGHLEQKYVDKESYEFLSKSNLYGREVLFANIGANVGEVWMMPEIAHQATIAPNMIIIRANNKNIVPEYLHSYFCSSIGLRQIDKIIAGSGHPKINKTELRKLLAILPPISEQQKISDILNSFDKKRQVLTEKKTQYSELKKGLMQQLLTGKIRVKLDY